MLFSILIPTYNNFNYLKLAIKSIKKNSKGNHEIIVHVNCPDKKTEAYLLNNKIKYTKSSENVGLCKSVNTAFTMATKKYIVYGHDDMYYLPDWDVELINEIKSINHNKFFLSSTQLSGINKNKSKINHIFFNAGHNIFDFNEKKLLQNFKKKKILQSSRQSLGPPRY